jgi:hypothetical protein
MRTLALFVALTAVASAGEFDKLAFLSGCWSAQMGPVTIEEQWNRPLGGLMLGSSRTIKAGKAVFHEFIRIEQRGGSIIYTPRVGATATSVSFRLVRLSENEVVFENPDHDFPQRIIYRSTPDGLAARIEGTKNGKARGEDFPYRRVACP